MKFAPKSLGEFLRHDFDEILDVRSPSEFSEDSIPGSINLPVLDDNERSLVGWTYKNVSRFKAQKMGAALVARNIAGHLENHLAHADGSYKPLVYCWRGGQRSGALATVLAQVGWNSTVLCGGYRTYRRLVVDFLYGRPLESEFILLDGNTGTSKTELLRLLSEHDVQTLDLERLANHRGSLFGARAGGQPSQKSFESMLASQLLLLDPTAPVVVEAESSRIGGLSIPPSLWTAMQSAARIEIEAPLKERARCLVRSFPDIVEDSARLKEILGKMRKLHSGKTVDHWFNLYDNGRYEAFAKELITNHYDPRYARQRSRDEIGPVEKFTLSSTSADGLEAAAPDLARTIRAVPSATRAPRKESATPLRQATP
ncbi:MAG: tRNA 2-selenouridine(34) synthase MnmH [Albidovulum sp.]|nr:tRNA 2-selenouridine(34) synthase MnmH [Albidovulum sp.]MDE0533282.1 tRNA 2-selenouridine(34) synthase MnmH [Albidovulum sp.]